ncbi:hypothetical protein MSPP1_003074 [Malassezia sp. CBS 17886]|nr:hypothetical protein MSPP1_003074 [Malassezia sp. CBS 17886]
MGADDGAKAEEKAFCDIYNVKETKLLCDDTVEQLLTRERHVNAKGKQKDGSADTFAPFKASHVIDDMSMVMSVIGSATIVAAVGYVYMKKIAWADAKLYYFVAIAIFVVLTAVQSVVQYVYGPVIFTGTRTLPSGRIEVERLRICAVPAGPTQVHGCESRNARQALTPPTYLLDVQYSRGGSSHVAGRESRITLGHFGEWFSSDGGFHERIFEERLIAALYRVFGE